MEPEVRKFLAVIVQCVSMILLWLMINTFFGIKLGLLFLEEPLTKWHAVYYAWLLASFVFVFIYVRRKMKSVPRFDLEGEAGDR